MSDSPLRKRKVLIKCPTCKGCKGVYGRSALGHPATLPCETCDATGEVDQSTVPFTLLSTIVEMPSTPIIICICDLQDECPVHPKETK